MTSEPTESRQPAHAHAAGTGRAAAASLSEPVAGRSGPPDGAAEREAEESRKPPAAVSDAQPAHPDEFVGRDADRTSPPPRVAEQTTATEGRCANEDLRRGARRQLAGSGHGNGRGAFHRLVGRREIAFAIVGIVNTAMGIGLTVAWLALLGDSVPPSVGVVAAYVTGIGIAFVLHRRLVFRVHGRVLRDFLGFAAVNCGGLVANALLLEVAVSLFGFPRAPSAVVVMGAVAAGTFFGHQYISFRRPAV